MGWSIPIVCKVSSGIGGIAWLHVFAAPELWAGSSARWEDRP